jgi:hypothetical protein
LTEYVDTRNDKRQVKGEEKCSVFYMDIDVKGIVNIYDSKGL